MASRAEEEAKEFYAKIGNVPCPLLGGEPVTFNSIGFRHLIRKRGIFRPKSEQRRRLALIRNAVDIVSGSGKLLSDRERQAARMVYRHGKRTHKPANAKFWTLVGDGGNKGVKVVIRQFRGGKKHFLSVYGKKNKKLPS